MSFGSEVGKSSFVMCVCVRTWRDCGLSFSVCLAPLCVCVLFHKSRVCLVGRVAVRRAMPSILVSHGSLEKMQLMFCKTVSGSVEG